MFQPYKHCLLAGTRPATTLPIGTRIDTGLRQIFSSKFNISSSPFPEQPDHPKHVFSNYFPSRNRLSEKQTSPFRRYSIAISPISRCHFADMPLPFRRYAVAVPPIKRTHNVKRDNQSRRPNSNHLNISHLQASCNSIKNRVFTTNGLLGRKYAILRRCVVNLFLK